MRILILLLGGALAALALVIYDIKYETRALDSRAADLRAAIQEERDAIAVLRAEWSLLNRPDRIERLAREHLGLESAPARRMITADRYHILVQDWDDDEPDGQPMAADEARPRPSLLAH